MTNLVLDASVAVKWFLPAEGEALSTEALTLFQSYVRQEIRFIVPDIFWAEIGSTCWKAIRTGRLQKSSAQAAITDLLCCKFPTFPIATLLENAFLIATEFERTIYDSLYVALAMQSGAELVTADERLANALASRFPVKWLGAIRTHEM